MKIIRVKITAESGHVPAEYEFRDSLIITENSIEYECSPYMPSDTNHVQSWAYRTNRPEFARQFKLAVIALKRFFFFSPESAYVDMPFVRFQVTDNNDTTIEKRYMINPNEYRECFACIMKMVPPSEQIPCMLQMPTDQQEE